MGVGTQSKRAPALCGDLMLRTTRMAIPRTLHRLQRE